MGKLYDEPTTAKKLGGLFKKGGKKVLSGTRKWIRPTEEEIEKDTKRLEKLAKREEARLKLLKARQSQAAPKYYGGMTSEPFKEYKRKPLEFNDIFK